MAFVEKINHRPAPVLQPPGLLLRPGTALGPGQSYVGNQRAAAAAVRERQVAVQQQQQQQQASHRSAPTLPRGAAIRHAPNASQFGRMLPASTDVREMAYRLRQEVEVMLGGGTSFLKFDAVAFRLQTLLAAQPSVEDRLARAVELTASARMARQVDGSFDFGVPMSRPPARTWLPTAGTPYLNPNKHVSYFEGLRSQQPKGHIHVYFIKVDAAWRGGFAHLHLRVRIQPQERKRPGVPCAIAPISESRFILEGIQGNLAADSPIDTFDANVSRPARAVHDHPHRLARTGATF